MYKVKSARYSDVRDVLDNLRKESHAELRAAGETINGGFILRCFLSEVSLCLLREDDLPICIFGANIRDAEHNSWQAWLMSTNEFGALAWRAARRGYIDLVIPAILAWPSASPPEVQSLLLRANTPTVRFVTSLGAARDEAFISEEFFRYTWDSSQLQSNLRQLAA